MQQIPMDTEPDTEYDIERPASRHRHVFKRPFLIRTRKNAGNDDYTSLLAADPSDPYDLGFTEPPRNRGWAIIQGVALIMVALSLTVAIHPIVIDSDVLGSVKHNITNSTTSPAVSKAVPSGSTVDLPSTSKPTPAPTPKATSEKSDNEDPWIKPGPIVPHHHKKTTEKPKIRETYPPTSDPPISGEPTAKAVTNSPTRKPQTNEPTPIPTRHRTPYPTEPDFQIYTEAPTPLKQTYANGTHGGEGPDVVDTITTLQRRCSTGYQTPHERARDTMNNYETALAAGFGYCGPDGEKHTSLSETVKHFSDTYPTYGSSGDGWMWLAPAERAVGVRHVSLPFHAMSVDGKPRTQGGDEFVLTFLGWTEPSKYLDYQSVLVKTAVIAQDRGNGKYDAFLAIPDVPFQSVTLTLSHYYGCYQGFFHDENHDSSDYFELDVGPQEVMAHYEFNDLVLDVGKNEEYAWWNEIKGEKVERKEVDRRWLTVPECDSNQMGVDGLTNGIWAEKIIKGRYLDDVTGDAVWLPLCCRPPYHLEEANHNQIRIGDATMPHPTLNVGDVYDITQVSHSQWVDYLVELNSEYKYGGSGFKSDKVLVLSAGLYYIINGYNPQTAAELVTRMLCQITLFFPGKVLWTGAVPVQQQIDPTVDVTDQNIRLFDATLRQKVEKAGGQLNEICEFSDVGDLYGFANPNDGSARIKGYSQHKYQKLIEENGKLAHSENFNNLDELLKKMSDKDMFSLWGDRKVVYADVDRFLRPRPDVYRHGDKVSEFNPLENGSSVLFRDVHNKLFTDMIQMRQLNNDL